MSVNTQNALTHFRRVAAIRQVMGYSVWNDKYKNESFDHNTIDPRTIYVNGETYLVLAEWENAEVHNLVRIIEGEQQFKAHWQYMGCDGYIYVYRYNK